MNKQLHETNQVILERIESFLNECPDMFTPEIFGVYSKKEDTELMYRSALIGALSLYQEDPWNEYFEKGIHMLDVNEYKENLYWKNVKFGKEHAVGEWTVGTLRFSPFEAFIADDFMYDAEGRVIPQIGFFNEGFKYCFARRNSGEWMTITPKEIKVMSNDLEKAKGNVLVYGLSLGYFPVMAAAKPEVKKVTVIERDASIVKLYEECVKPCFDEEIISKIEIVTEDALTFAEKVSVSSEKEYDFIYADLWRDAADGLPEYERLKDYEREDTEYGYWLADSLRNFLY